MVLSARKSAFSAPRICTVLAGYLDRLVSEPACEMRRAATVSPMSAPRLGATSDIFSLRYIWSDLRYANRLMTRSAKLMTLSRSMGAMSVPMDARAASMTFFARVESASRMSVSDET